MTLDMKEATEIDIAWLTPWNLHSSLVSVFDQSLRIFEFEVQTAKMNLESSEATTGAKSFLGEGKHRLIIKLKGQVLNKCFDATSG